MMMIIFPKVNEFMVKKDEDGTTSDFKKIPLILNGFLARKMGDYKESMT